MVVVVVDVSSTLVSSEIVSAGVSSATISRLLFVETLLIKVYVVAIIPIKTRGSTSLPGLGSGLKVSIAILYQTYLIYRY